MIYLWYINERTGHKVASVTDTNFTVTRKLPNMPSESPTLSCIIVTYHPGQELINCLRSLQDFVRCPYEVIISDNTAGESKTIDNIEGLFPNAIVIRNAVNAGFSYGNNRGAQQALGRYLLLLNPDAELLSPITYEMISNSDEYGIIAGVSEDSAGKYKRTAGRFPVKPIRAFSLTGRMDQRPDVVSGKFSNHFIDIDYNEGSCYLIRRDLFVSVGGFDERIFLYGEDYELSYRVALSGRSNCLDTSLRYRHDGGYSDRREPHIVNGLIYFSRKHFGLLQEVKMRSVLLARYAVLLGITLFKSIVSNKARIRVPSVVRALRNVLTANPYLRKPFRVQD